MTKKDFKSTNFQRRENQIFLNVFSCSQNVQDTIKIFNPKKISEKSEPSDREGHKVPGNHAQPSQEIHNTGTKKI